MSIKLSISISNGKVRVKEGSKDATHVRARAGRRLSWKASSGVSKFKLEFFRVCDGEGAADLEPDWPFVATKVVPDNAPIDEFEGRVTGAKQLFGRLAADPGIFKYTITATTTGNQPADIILDPQIIIEK